MPPVCTYPGERTRMRWYNWKDVTWKDRTPNGSEEIADFLSEENWWNGTNSRSGVEVADAPNDDENDGLGDRFAGHIPHHIAMMPIGDEDRTKLDSRVCAVFPSHAVLQGRCELPPIPSETHAIKP